MEKIDLKKLLSSCYKAKKEVTLVDVPAIHYLCYEGTGNPDTSPDFQDAMGILYGMVYTIKFICKENGRDFTVMPLESQWWTEKPEEFSMSEKDKWLWKVMIAVPDFINGTLFLEGKNLLEKKKNPQGLDKTSLEVMQEGLSAQILYIGPYAEEAPYVAKMHKKIEEMGYRFRGRHREIYFNSPQRVSPEKPKTIIRHPVEKK
jgi:hypothetical protein